MERELKTDIIFSRHKYGLLVESDSFSSITKAVTSNWLLEKLTHYGVLIFRGFSSNLNIFSSFISQHSKRVTADPARKASTENAQLIDVGDVEMGLHVENGSLPFLPEAQWFFCEKAARTGSETTLCDGVFIWDKLARKTQELFFRRRILYTRNIPELLWKKYLSLELEVPIENIDHTHLEQVNRIVEGQLYKINPDGSVFSRYKVWAVHPTQFSPQLAFANSMLGPSVNYEPPQVRWEDGSIISPRIWDELLDVTEQYTDVISWKDGDIVVLDNTRIMHGRRKVLDIERKIYGSQSYLKKINIKEPYSYGKSEHSNKANLILCE